MFAQCGGIWVTITTHYIHLPTTDSTKQILAVLRQSAMTHSQTNIWQRTVGFHTTLWVTLTPSQLFSALTAALFECLISPPGSGCPVVQRGEAGQHLEMAQGVSTKCQEGLFLHVIVLVSHHAWAQFLAGAGQLRWPGMAKVPFPHLRWHKDCSWLLTALETWLASPGHPNILVGNS